MGHFVKMFQPLVSPSLQPEEHCYGKCQGHPAGIGSFQDLGIEPRGGVTAKMGTEGREDRWKGTFEKDSQGMKKIAQ